MINGLAFWWNVRIIKTMDILKALLIRRFCIVDSG